jgi:hypothetical protein
MEGSRDELIRNQDYRILINPIGLSVDFCRTFTVSAKQLSLDLWIEDKLIYSLGRMLARYGIEKVWRPFLEVGIHFGIMVNSQFFDGKIFLLKNMALIFGII